VKKLLVTGAIAATVFVAIGLNRPIWADDADAVRVARLGFHGIIDALRGDNGPPVYYFLLAAWMRVFGESEIALRALSSLFYLTAAGVVACIAFEVYLSRRAAVYSALLYLASGQMIRQAHTVRAYTLLALLVALSMLLYFRCRGVAWMAVNFIGLLTHFWFFFVLLAQVVASPREWKRIAAPIGAFAIVWGPIFRAQLGNASSNWFPKFKWSFVPEVFVKFYEYREVALLLFGACAVALVVGERGFLREERTRVLLIIVVVCAFAPLVVTVFKPIYYQGRYTTIALPALAVFAGGVLGRFAVDWLCYTILAAGLTMSVATRGGTVFGNLPPEHSDRSTVQFLMSHAAPGDALVFTCLTRNASDYYLRRRGAAARFLETTYPTELDRHPGWRDNPAMLRNPQALDADADALTARLADAVRSGHRVWLYYGQDLEVADRLKTRLDRAIGPPDRHIVRGPCHIFVLEYGTTSFSSPRPPEDSAALRSTFAGAAPAGR
jgi:hypothetical protein